MARKAMGPATLALHQAVTRCLDQTRPSGPVLVACSGGPDSLALALVTGGVTGAVAGAPPGTTSLAVIIDHGLQTGSAEVAGRVRRQLTERGLAAEVVTVRVSGTGGPEAAARDARYAALTAAAQRHGSDLVLLGHTLDDQAETVLLGLGRGSGARSLAGMPSRRGLFARPLLGLRRSVTAEACAELGIEPWYDPHNDDPAFTRVRVRGEVMAVLERQLGPGVAEALARSALQLRDDADLLDDLAAQAYPGVLTDDALSCDRLELLAPSLRSRVLRRYLLGHGATEVTAAHLDAVVVLLDDWRGQRWVDLPGVRVIRDHDLLRAVAG